MRIITKASEIDKTLVKLMKCYNKYYIATAWASIGSKASFELLKNKESIEQMIVGTHFYQTHPDFIEKFVDSEKVKFILKTNGVYHPKVYLFLNTSNEWECLIGSANFTTSALSKNAEIMVHIKSSDSNSINVLNDLLSTINSYWNEAEIINMKEFLSYKNIWKKNKNKIDNLKGIYGNSEGQKPLVKSELFSLEWSEYYKNIKKDKFNSFHERLEVLSIINEYFNSEQKFCKFTDIQRKQVAGITSDSDINWKWFGSMVGAGKFKNRINTNNRNVSDALDAIPLEGSINRNHYIEFVNKFKLAFPDGGAGVAIASRLLAMKRPDYFVCLDKQNRKMLCCDFSIPSTVSFDTYWDNIIERIIDSVWWQSARPVDKIEEQAWLGRAALIDSIFYEV